MKEAEVAEYSAVEELFRVKSDVFMLGQPQYGAQGQVRN